MSDWRHSAACASGAYDPDIWYSVHPEERRAAIQVCKTVCPVRAQCADAARKNHEKWGVWSGRDLTGTKEDPREAAA